MCLCYFIIDDQNEYKFILAFNREEDFDRKTQVLDQFAEDSNIYAGKDVLKGGTWLGFNKLTRNIAFLTNYTDLTKLNEPKKDYKTSRGELITNFLQSEFYNEIQDNSKIDDYLNDLKKNKNEYANFNITIGNLDSMYFLQYNNAQDYFQIPQKNVVHTVCNLNFFDNKLVPKQIHGKKIFEQLIRENDSNNISNKLFEFMNGKYDLELPLKPQQYQLLHWQLLNQTFTRINQYGCTQTTIILLNKNGNLTIQEYTWMQNDYSLTIFENI